MLRVDLHTHSNFSDGTFHPKELVECAKKHKIVVLSLTDHDSVDGVPAFLQACGKTGIKGVAGVELSAEYKDILHILGYRFDFKKLERHSQMKQVRDGREARNIQICKKLQEMGLNISMDDVKAFGVVARPHIARALVAKGYAKNISDAFTKYLDRNAPAYCGRFRLNPKECVSMINEAGGLAVMAHPGQTARGESILELKPLVRELKNLGLWGIECYTTAHSAVQIYESLKIAQEFDLYPTAGSDFHGEDRSCSLGVRVQDGLLPWARFCGGL